MAVEQRKICGYDARITRRRDSRRIRLRVNADGSLRVTAPLWARVSEIEELVASHMDWIEGQVAKLADNPMAQAEHATDAQRREWRVVVEGATRALLGKWEPIMGVRVRKLAFRSMKSRWGSCQPTTGRVCINTRLALYPPECLEDVVVPELCHMLEPSHNARFHALMTQFLPDWKVRRAKLR